MLENIYTINIGGVERNIISFDKMLMHELGDFEFGIKSLTPHQYMSILFNNLGYKACPKNFDWIKNKIPIEEVPKTELLDYPITRNKLMIIKNKTTLFDFLLILKNWISAGLERGHVLEPSKSFKLPSMEEMQFNISNGIQITKSYSLRVKTDYWDKANVFWRRLYNLSPNLDKEYFTKCISNFEGYAKQIIMQNPCEVFTSCLINPDIILSAIRSAEKEAFDILYNKVKDKLISPALIPDYNLTLEFINTFYHKTVHIANIFKNKGASGFIRKTQNRTLESYNGRIATVGYGFNTFYPIADDGTIALDNITIDTLKNQIYSTILDGDHKSYILQYTDGNSLSCLDNMDDNSTLRMNTYKKLYYTLNQIKQTNPELLNRKEKFIFSEPFFVNEEVFALYHKPKNKFFITSPDLSIKEMSPQEAIDYYKTYMSITVFLDPKEVSDSFDSPLVEDIDLEQMERDSLDINWNLTPVQNLDVNNETPNVFVPVTPLNPTFSQGVYVPANQSQQGVNGYGFDPATMVQWN